MNIYHLLRFIPATEAWEMPPALERLARDLVASGKLRINADHQRNFVQHGTADTDQTFSARELTDPALQAVTRERLRRHVPGAHGEQGAMDLLERLRAELKKTGGVPLAKELKVARVLVQSAHPTVIQLLLQTGAEVYVSYSHNVGDLMALHFWQGHGSASGLQATADNGTAVYVSCSGDPFFEGEEKTYTTDGWPALARMVVIAGQELCHFADLIHTPRGIVGRYSTDNHADRLCAAPIVRGARQGDIARIHELRARYGALGLNRLLRAEQRVAFYAKRLKYSPPWFFAQLWRFAQWRIFTLRTRRDQLHLRLPTYPRHRHGDALQLFLTDMASNLAPQAEVYKRDDPEEEEAIACIEALARVPQQMHKWGRSAVHFAWPGMARYYEEVVLPGTRAALTTTPISININIYQKLKVFIHRARRPRPAYYPER